MDLAALLVPVRVEDFVRDTWERAPLHHRRGDSLYYDALISNEAVERIVNSADLRYPAIQLAKNGSYYPAEAYTRNVKHGSEVFAGVPDLEKVRSEYRAGATVVLPALHRTWRPLGALCESVETQLGHAVHANLYLTPGHAHGFTPHYDTHDVFVLQIAGKKHWRVHEPPLRLPHSSQPFSPVGYTPPAQGSDFDLEAGDLLYLPRGYVHSASTSDGHSVHVSVGVTVFTWVELFSELLQSSKGIPAFREALPVGFTEGEASRRALGQGLARRVADLTSHVDYERLIDAFRQRVRATRSPRAGRGFESNVQVLGLETELVPAEKPRYAIGTENGNTTLELDGRKLVLPAEVRATLEAMCAQTSFCVTQLPADLDEHARLAFARFLEDVGFLKRAR